MLLVHTGVRCSFKMPLKRERSSLQCLVSQIQDISIASLPVEILQQIGGHLTCRERCVSILSISTKTAVTSSIGRRALQLTGSSRMSDNSANSGTMCRACCFPLICKAFKEASDPQAVGNLWSCLALSARSLRIVGDLPYEQRLSWVGSRIKQVGNDYLPMYRMQHNNLCFCHECAASFCTSKRTWRGVDDQLTQVMACRHRHWS